MKLLDRLREQPLGVRKTILWAVVVIVGIVLIVWWLNTSFNRIENIKSNNLVKDLNLPDFKDSGIDTLPQLPNLDIQLSSPSPTPSSITTPTPMLK